MLINLQQ